MGILSLNPVKHCRVGFKADFEPQIRADSEDFADWLQAAESVII
ncbi:Uncharacterized protein dnm_066660 [Desulfonema magnum]|uniref:Uncharacterized protein n=1 Tax=Desulfonema magnum TaxID=45655 RepID=A0A975BS67_9BACT|nr:Uncharacterized protein dnm_066660 [Desulfonema magnum]